MKNENKSSSTVKSITTLFSIVDFVYEHEQAGVTQTASHLDIAKSTAHKHLKTLEEEGFVRNRDGKYTLNLKFLMYGGGVRDRMPLFQYGRAKVEEIATEIDELISLWIKEGNHSMFLYWVNDKYGIYNTTPLGSQFPLHQNAAGKSMLAKLSDEEIESILDQSGLPSSTEHTISNREALFDEIHEIRDQGYGLNFGERDSDIQAVSAAFQDMRQEKIGAISISLPNESPSVDLLELEYAQVVQQAASEVSLRLKHQ